MNDKNIFPQEILDNCYEKIIKDFSCTTKGIYIVLLLSCIITLISSFYIYVDIGINAVGVIKPIEEQIIITSPRDGIIKGSKLKIGERAKKGETLFVVWSDNIEATLPNMMKRKEEVENMLIDIGQLLYGGKNVSLKTNKYSMEYKCNKTNLKSLTFEHDKKNKDFERAKVLYSKGFISANEFEEKEELLNQSQIALEREITNFRTQLESERMNFQEELRQINNNITLLKIQKNEAYIKSPFDGSIIKLYNIENGTFVQEGQQIMQLSPDNNLYAECFIQPNDIGLIKKGMRVKINVDTFNYNQWGNINGKVKIISSDVISNENGSFFRVYCTLSKDFLELKNGVRGEIKKGMTINVHMVVTKRTLFQLVYDKMDDWLNPMLKTKENFTTQ